MPLHVKQPRLRRLVAMIGEALAEGAAARVDELRETLDDLLAQAAEAELEQLLRARALVHVLEDMHAHGWEVSVEEHELYLCEPPPLDARDPREHKAADRARMRPRVVEQLLRETQLKLVKRLEVGDPRTGRSIAALIADGARLARSLDRDGASAIQPYLQTARPSDGVDTYTGLRLHDCFLYLRFHWSFPYESTPGRRLPLLIRDAGQPHHPIIGLLCLSSPLPELSARDAHLGWTPAWMEAQLAGLEACERALRGDPDALAELGASLHSAPGSPREALLCATLAEALGLPVPHDLNALRRALLRGDQEARLAMLHQARAALIGGLLRAVEDGLRALSFDGLGVTSPLDDEDALISETIRTLAHAEHDAHTRWRLGREAGQAANGLREALFMKKRAKRAIALMHAFEELAPLRAALSDPDALRAALCDALPACELLTLSPGGASLCEGLRIASREHKINMLASQLAEVSVCGALPPYNQLLGGKLIAAMALSREVAQRYYDAYDGQISHIQSQLNGEDFTRPASLLALSTTSFYGVGSAQYNRIALPASLGGARWREVGASQGNGTLHFSPQTSEALQLLLTREEGSAPISGIFGEGPSERLRKLRDGLQALGLPADKLLKHGMKRIVYVATLDGACRPGVSPAAPQHERGPYIEEITSWWRARWLEPRLDDAPRREALLAFKPADALVSNLYPEVREALSIPALQEQEGEDEL
jgi:hypothetical protein